MPFIEVQKTRIMTGVNIITPMVSAVKTAKGEVDIYFKLPRELVHTTWQDKIINDGRSVRLGLLEGTEGDAGFIMLVHNPIGYTFTAAAYAKSDNRPSAAAFTCKIDLSAFKNYVPKIVPQLPTAMEHSVDGQAMLLQMPEWFVYTPKVTQRSTLVPVQKAPQGAPAAAITNQRRLVR